MSTYTICSKTDAADLAADPNVKAVRLTSGANPVVIFCNEEDARKLELLNLDVIQERLPYSVPRLHEYNATLHQFIGSLIQVWPRRTPPSWSDLTEILNTCGMLTANQIPWAKANIIQKFASIGINKEDIVNPDGDYGQGGARSIDITKEVAMLPEAVKRVTNPGSSMPLVIDSEPKYAKPPVGGVLFDVNADQGV